MASVTVIELNPLFHNDVIWIFLTQTTFKNIVTKREMAPFIAIYLFVTLFLYCREQLFLTVKDSASKFYNFQKLSAVYTSIPVPMR